MNPFTEQNKAPGPLPLPRGTRLFVIYVSIVVGVLTFLSHTLSMKYFPLLKILVILGLNMITKKLAIRYITYNIKSYIINDQRRNASLYES